MSRQKTSDQALDLNYTQFTKVRRRSCRKEETKALLSKMNTLSIIFLILSVVLFAATLEIFGSTSVMRRQERYLTESHIEKNLRPLDDFRNESETGKKSPCYVAIENKVDVHYEVIESAVMRYPLPWDALNCSSNTPVVFDIALVDPSNQNVAWGIKGETEGWALYFEERLRGTERVRSDGVKIAFGNLVDYHNYTRSYDALIGLTCEVGRPYVRRFLESSPTSFCIYHERCQDCPAIFHQRGCYLNPMHPECFFIPSDLPQFDDEVETSSAIMICAPPKNQELLVEALNRLGNKWDVRVAVIGRASKKVHNQYARYNLSHLVDVIQEPNFLLFQKAISKCDILLPLIDPENDSKYFPRSRNKQLSGYVSQIVGYRIPSVMHIDLESLYHDWLPEAIEVYNSTKEFSPALERMLSRFQQSRTT